MEIKSSQNRQRKGKAMLEDSYLSISNLTMKLSRKYGTHIGADIYMSME
jgi:hypothetical protein